MRLLYVEDDPMSRQILQMILTRGMGYQDVIVFEDSTDFEARFAALSPPPRIIFLDIHMEPLSGFEMLDILRTHPNATGATIIALTASVMNEEIHALRRAGFDGAIAKPIKQTIFPALLQQIINGESVWFIS
jgi:CheY-like chemotaxis protein